MTQIVLIRVDLDISATWSVGGLALSDDEVKLPILSDPRGEGDAVKPFLPATSLIGSLRRHLGAQAEAWLGPYDAGDDGAASSALRCLGTRLAGTVAVERSSTTAIDADRGAAKDGMLRTAQVVNATEKSPTVVRWWLQHDLASQGSILDLLDALWGWRPFVGRGRSVGQGDARVTQVCLAELDLSRDGDLGWWLGERHRWDGVMDDYAPPGWRAHPRPDGLQAAPAHELVVEFVADEPLFLGGGPVTTPAGSRGQVQHTQHTIAGSSWKGLFRHRVEHVLSVCGLDHAARRPVVDRLFGSGREEAASQDAGERGILRFLPTRIDESAGTITNVHIAIDRVTGGARDRSGTPSEDAHGGSLYTIEAYAPGASVRLRVGTLAELSDAERNVLEHVIHDIGTGVVGVGGMTTRGYGTLALATKRPRPGPVHVDELVGNFR